MQLHFNRVARGPAWERWAILESQLGENAFAGEVILTYTDDTAYADVECSVLFARVLETDEIEEVLEKVSSLLSGRGNITLYATQEEANRGFSMVEDDDEDRQS